MKEANYLALMSLLCQYIFYIFWAHVQASEYVYKHRKTYFMPQFFQMSGDKQCSFYSHLQGSIKDKMEQQGVS